MIAFPLAVLTVVAGGVTAGYAGSNSENDLGYGGSGNSYGYSGSFSGSGPPPNFAFPGFDFPGFFGNYVDSLSRYHQDFIRKGGGALSYSYAASSPAASARAQSSLTFKNSKGRAQSSLTFKNSNGIQSNAQGGYGQSGGYSGGFGGSFGGGGDGGYGGSFSGPGSYSYSSPNTGPRVYHESNNFAQRGSFGPGSGAASSSASVGPGGVQQSASVFPENPNSPNINTRFGASSGPGGFRSVFTSSESHTSNVGGKPVTQQRAHTTVNDNGKVTTYTVKNP